jgi:hypothetical protein
MKVLPPGMFDSHGLNPRVPLAAIRSRWTKCARLERRYLIFCYKLPIELTLCKVLLNLRSMTKADLSELRLAYKKAVDEWVEAIRAEEALATTDHSVTEMEKWDAAHFTEQDAQTKATAAREAYKDSLREVNYGI